jgi:predicted transposase YbfD/YdcC
MDYNTLGEPIEPLELPAEKDVHCLYMAFEQITDGRKKRGVRYPLAVLLTLIVLAKLAGEVHLNGVVDWVRLRHEWLNQMLGLQQRRWPCFSTYTYALSKLDASECTAIISAALMRLEASRRCGCEPSRLLSQPRALESRHVAFDGKALRGTHGHEAAHQPAVHLCAFYEVATGNVLAQREVGHKENEISASKQMLTPLLVKGRVISADAMHTQRLFCQTVKRYGGDFVLIAKDNQPTMHADLELFFEDPDADRTTWRSATCLNKGHGRHEKRVITTSTDLRDWFAKEWSGIEQVFRIQRWVRRKGHISQEVLYGITSLSPTQADARQVGELVRAHWSIENRLHWRRDVTLQEDRSQVRTRHVPALLALLNCTVLTLMDLLGVRNVAARMRRYAARPWEALQLLVGTL